MSTTRLYYTNAALTEFEATVERCDAAGERFAVTLDRTAFYPTSGGQPFDTGTLGEASVVDVIDDHGDVIVHVVDRKLTPGSPVSGRIDWRRRFDHMQQHTGQHVLSAAFDRLVDARTTSFHLGPVSATIDLGREVSAAEIAAAETEANHVVWQDRAVTVRVVSADEAATLPLRKEPTRTGPLRLVDVADFDLSACGGTHVQSTGSIGVIAVAGWEKFRGGSRVEFLCGGRALTRFHEWRDTLLTSTRLLSIAAADVPANIERLLHEAKSAQRALRDAQERLAAHEGRQLLQRGQVVDGRRQIVEALDGWDMAGLKSLASAAVAAEPTAAVVLFSKSRPAVVVAARGPAARVDMAALVKRLFAVHGGKGGGRPELAQGGGLDEAPDALVVATQRLLSES